MKTFLLCDKFLSFEHNVSGIADCEVRDILDTGLILGRSKLAQMG